MQCFAFTRLLGFLHAQIEIEIGIAIANGNMDLTTTHGGDQRQADTRIMSMPMENAALVCRDVSKSYNGVMALKNISFSLRKGDIGLLLGPNGAGKTTLLKILATLVAPSSGTAWVMGGDIRGRGGHVRGLIGLAMPESVGFYRRLTARGNLRFFGALHGMRQKDCDRRMMGLLGELGLSGIADMPVSNCSDGMRQALGMARALLHDPPVVLLDEPTRGLSPETSDRALGLLDRLARREGKTLLIATHRLEEAETLAGRVFILNNGRLVSVSEADEPADDTRPRNRRLAALYAEAIGGRAP